MSSHPTNRPTTNFPRPDRRRDGRGGFHALAFEQLSRLIGLTPPDPALLLLPVESSIPQSTGKKPPSGFVL
ncbi:MAG TPA: hypothetical protein VMC09_13845 [Anaerolineales bacterium]|nr:hypothetical protein [Anaerolineales bacterium]